MHFGLQVQKVHLRYIRVVIVQRFFKLFVGFIYLGLSIACNADHFFSQKVVVIVGLQFYIFFMDLVFDIKAFLLQVSFQRHFTGTVLSQIQRLDKFCLNTPERAHLGKIVHFDGIAVLQFVL